MRTTKHRIYRKQVEIRNAKTFHPYLCGEKRDLIVAQQLLNNSEQTKMEVTIFKSETVSQEV